MSLSLPTPSLFNKGKLGKGQGQVDVIKEMENCETGEEWEKGRMKWELLPLTKEQLGDAFLYSK